MQESNSELLFLEYAKKFIGALGDALGQPQCQIGTQAGSDCHCEALSFLCAEIGTTPVGIQSFPSKTS